eukprot:g3231.t1
MGIPGLNSWFLQKFSHSYVSLANVKIDHIYIDMNSVLHLALRRADNMHHFYCLVFQKCDEILTYCQPRKSVFFALDGPAPIAKLLTQRLRRKRMTLTPAEKRDKIVSPLAITPGTPFMEQVHEALAYYICQRLINHKWKHLRMELSGSTVQGEGECKILCRLQTPLKYMNDDDVHVLIGNDSDLLMMGLMANCNNLFVFGQILNHIKTPPRGYRSLRAFSSKALEAVLNPLVSDNGFLRGVRYDMVITCILTRGNDYIPSVAGLPTSLSTNFGSSDAKKGDEGLWKTYVRLRSTNEYKSKSISVFKDQGEVLLDYEFLYQLLKASNLQIRLERKVPEYQKAPDPHLYLDGLQWILTMYAKGVCPDYRFVYDGLGPSHNELCQALLDRCQNKSQDSQLKKKPTLPLKPSECALAMLPYHARRYIPKSLQHLMDPSSPIGDLYQECEECNTLSKLNSKASQRLLELRKREEEFRSRLERNKNNAEGVEKINKQIQSIEKSIEDVRAKLRDLGLQRETHNIEKHPYQPFPVERIEEAVRNISIKKFSQTEHALFRFGDNYVFQRMQQSVKSSNFTPLKNLYRISNNPPAPPSEQFKKFKLPLPILRGTFTGDRMAMNATSSNVRRFFRVLRRL